MKKLSIIIPTLGRLKEVDSLLKSIISFGNNHLEVIIVDQNFSDLLDPIVDKYLEVLEIHHYKVDFRGLSKAKNYGLKKSIGDIICFIDDDAEFCQDVIETAMQYLEADESLDVVCGRCIDRLGNDSVMKFIKEKSYLSLSSFEGKFIESTMFFKKNCFDSIQYDENLGIGAFHGAEEGYDLVYRMLNSGKKILFDPLIVFYHPQTILSRNTAKEIRRVFSYRCGFAYVCKKHNLRKKYYLRIVKVTCYIPYCFLFNRMSFRYYLAELLGLVSGRVIE